MSYLARALGATILATAVAVAGSAAGSVPAAAEDAAPPAVRTTGPAGTAADAEASLLDLFALGPALLGGLPVVGQSLEITAPEWSLPGVTTQFAWLKNGVPVTGATGSTYTPSLADVGSVVQGVVKGTLLGLVPVTVLTNPVTILQEIVDTVLAPLAPASIAGDPHPGELLTAVEPVWNLLGVLNSYQWLADGVPIPGATGLTYLLKPEDLDTTISVLVTGLLGGAGGSTGTSSSPPLNVVNGLAPLLVGAPRITGILEVGQVLTADPGSWNPVVSLFAFQWFRGGQPIAGATQGTYQTTALDAGKQLTVRVATQLLGRAVATATSPPVTVAGTSAGKRSSASGLVVKKRKVVKGKPLPVRLGVYAQGGTPTGSLTLLDGKRRLRVVRLRGPAGEARVVKVKVRLRTVGKHRLRAVYSGDAATSPSRSTVVTVKVVKPRRKQR